MKNTIRLVSMALLTLSSSAFAADYTCTGEYNDKLVFDLRVGRKEATLSVRDLGCKADIDPTYRPTAKYAGYSRFTGRKSDFIPCMKMVSAMVGKGNAFHSIKVSGALMDGEDYGSATIVLDMNDFHGALTNEKVGCITK
jgi:hypothetical protein